MKQSTYTIIVHENEADEEAGFWVEVPTLPGCFSRGDTYEEAVANSHEAILCCIESLIEHGEPIPVEEQHPAIIGVQVAIPA